MVTCKERLVVGLVDDADDDDDETLSSLTNKAKIAKDVVPKRIYLKRFTIIIVVHTNKENVPRWWGLGSRIESKGR